MQEDQWDKLTWGDLPITHHLCLCNQCLPNSLHKIHTPINHLTTIKAQAIKVSSLQRSNQLQAHGAPKLEKKKSQSPTMFTNQKNLKTNQLKKVNSLKRDKWIQNQVMTMMMRFNNLRPVKKRKKEELNPKTRLKKLKKSTRNNRNLKRI
jgi:uncharacterized protein YcbK (DUF882 family)